MEKIEIKVNGELITINPEVDTVEKLVQELNLAQRKFFIIEQNREVIQKDQYATTPVNPNDQFEIVHFVGGG